MNQIVCLSTSNWHPYPTRKHQVMQRLYDCEILYFDPPITLIAPLKDPTLKGRLTAYKGEGEQVTESIKVYATPPVLPFGSKYRWINRINQRILASYVKKRMAENNMDSPVLWAYTPSSCDIVEHVPHTYAVYDCVDRHSGYKGMLDPDVVDKMEEDLARQCDTVFCTADGLYDTLSQYNNKTYMIPNGANYELFSQAQRTDLTVPADIADIKTPIVGFVGMLQECIDYDMIIALAKARPDVTVVFVGKPLPGVDISPLEALSNVRLCGLKPQPELPKYLARFDVCINPFQAGRLSRDVSPLKFYEYLATGKPIVASPEPVQVLSYEDVVYIARDNDEFVRLCGKALEENDPQKVEKRLKYAKACSWDARVDEISQILYDNNVLVP